MAFQLLSLLTSSRKIVRKSLKYLKELVQQFNPEVKVAISTAFAQGGQGTTQLAQHVIDACTQPTEFRPLYNKEQIVTRKTYGCV